MEPVDEVASNVGVAVSGGGYRAAAWGLGTLLYLVDAGLNSRVTTISSVSGGSIPNAVLGAGGYATLDAPAMRRLGANLAERLAGNLWLFLGVLALHVGAWVLAIVWAAKQDWTLTWIALGAAALLSIVLAFLCGDAVFRRPVVWLYLDVLAASLAVFSWAIDEEWWWLVGALVLVGVVALFRGVVIGWAMASTVPRRGRRRVRLSHLSEEIDHVFCACDLHGRYHVYFGKDFVYSYARGLGARSSLPLSAAVQASADLPGAFPPRGMRSRPFGFSGGFRKSPLLALTDGGVYDNMADEWLLEFGRRIPRLRTAAATSPAGPARESLERAVDRLAERTPTFVVVANASGPLDFKFAWTTFIPIVGELLSLLRVKSILYDNGHTTRRRLLVDKFMNGELRGILVHISTDPWSVVADGRRQQDPTIQARAEEAARRLEAAGLGPEATATPAAAGTVLYPLRRGRIAKLLQRSYALAFVQGHIWHNLRPVDIPPLEWFEALEAGRVAAT